MSKALWRRAFDAVEGALGPQVEQLVHQRGFSTAVVVVRRGRGLVGRVGESASRRVWHGLNLPAGSDVRRLRRQLGDLDREVRLVRHALDRAASPTDVAAGGASARAKAPARANAPRVVRDDDGQG